MLTYVINMLKGALMGAANVIPGVSGGTIALLTGIFEKLINSIKAFDVTAIKLACAFKLKELFEHVNFKFLSAIGIGVIVSVLSFAKALEYLFENRPLEIWAFFFGLILASVYFVGRKISKAGASVMLLFGLGTAIAVTIAFLEPAAQNDSFPYLMLCGAVAMCSMILPGLSGSFVLLLMGNYELVMIHMINERDIMIFIPVAIGAGLGLIAFARVLSWIFRKFHDQTVALLTGFIFGSLAILWPWKNAVLKTFQDGEEIKEKVAGYDYYMPDLSAETFVALAVMLAGVVIIVGIETMARKTKAD